MVSLILTKIALLESFSICFSGTGIQSSMNVSCALFQLIDKKVFFFTCKKIQIYLSSHGEKMQSISQPNKLHPTLWQYCHTPSLLGFISNIAYWPHSGAPAVLTCSCCHFLAVRLLPHFALQHRTDHLCMTGRRQTTSEETCWVCLHGVLQTLDSEPYFSLTSTRVNGITVAE